MSVRRRRPMSPIGVDAGVLGGSTSAIILATWLVPQEADTAAAVTSTAAVYYGFALTAISVILTVIFSGSSQWPSVRRVARHTMLIEFVSFGALATLVGIVGVVSGNSIVRACGSYMWIVACSLSMFTMYRSFGLASQDGMDRFLTSLLRRAFSGRPDAKNATILAEHYTAVGDSIADGGSRLVNLVGQLAGAAAVTDARPDAIRYTYRVANRVLSACIYGSVDAQTACRSLESILGDPRDPGGDRADATASVVRICAAARWAAWMMHTTLIAHSKDLCSTATARQLVEFGISLRDRLLRLLDPDPAGGRVSDEPSPVNTPELALYVFWSFQAHQGHGCGVAGYIVYQLLTGKRYGGDYYAGARILEDLRNELFSDEHPPLGVGPLGTATDFDDFFAEAMALQIQSARDRAIRHPSALRLGDFTDRDSTPEALMSMATGLSPLATPEDARTGLLRILCESPGRALARRVEGSLAETLPVTDGGAETTAPALVLVQCIRLERAAEGSSAAFLPLLSEQLRSSAADLARRLTPAHVASPSTESQVSTLIRHLQTEFAAHV